MSVLRDPTLGIGSTVSILCLTLAFKYPRQALFAFIIYVPLSGTVTYALGGNPVLQLAKDAIYLPALIGVWQFCRRTRQAIIIPQFIKFPLLLLLTILMMTLLVVNGSQQLAADGEMPILMGLLGLKVLLGYLPIIACIYYLIRDRQDLYFMLRLQVMLVIICCGLGLIQYLMLRTGICPTIACLGEECFKAAVRARCFVGGSLLYQPSFGQIRLSGTFVAPWQWGWFLIASGFFGFGTTFSDRSPFWRLMGLISIVMVGVMAVLSGQRIALALVPVTIVGLLFMTGQIANLKRFIPIGVVLGLVLSFLAIQNPEIVSERWDSFVDRWEASPPHEFIIEQFEWSLNRQEGILGRGLGRATNSARIFGDTRLLETYHPKVLYEIGPVGLFAVMVLYTAITYTVYRAYRTTKSPDLRGYGASMFVFVLFISYFPYYYALDVDPVNVYYWMAAGIALKLPEIDAQERLQQRLDKAGEDRKLSKRDRKRLKAQQRTITFS